MRFKLALVCATALVSGCSAPPMATPTDATTPHTCATGEPVSFGLVATSGFTPNAASIHLGVDHPWDMPAPSEGMNARLDICVVGVTPHLERVIWQNDPYEFRNEALGSQILRVQGLDEALSGNHTNLEIRVDNNEAGLLIKGWKQGSNSFATAVPVVYLSDGSYEVQSIRLVTGALDAIDPFANNKCEPGSNSKTASFSLGTARFTWEACTFLGGGQTNGYKVNKVVVTDSNPALTPEHRAEVVLEGDALTRAFKSQWNHHNACDSFVLELPHASYAATAAAAAGCGTILPNAPARTHTDERSNTLFRTRYETLPWSEVQVQKDCAHFLFHCQ
jgi:hypothetical protein